MKKNTFKLVLLTAVVLVTIVSVVVLKNKTAEKPSGENNFFDIKSFENKQVYANYIIQGYISSDKWMLIDENYQQFMVIDLSSGKKYPLCFDPTCKHDLSEGSSCLSSSEGFSKGILESFFFYNGFLYTVYRKNLNILGIYKKDVFNNSCTMVASYRYPDDIGRACCYPYNGKLYIAAAYADPSEDYNVFSNGRVGSKKSIRQIDIVDLESGQRTTIGGFECQYDSTIQVNCIMDDNIYMYSYYNTIPEEEIYDIETGEPLVKNPEQYIVNECYSTSVKNPELIEKINETHLANDGRLFIFRDNENNLIKYEDGKREKMNLEYYPTKTTNWDMVVADRHIYFNELIYGDEGDERVLTVLDSDGKLVQQVRNVSYETMPGAVQGLYINTKPGLNTLPNAYVPQEILEEAIQNREFDKILEKAIMFENIDE